jgi:chemotaxis protein methyltransferase CheR
MPKPASRAMFEQFFDHDGPVIRELQSDVRGFEQLAKHLKHFAGIYLPENEKNRVLVASRLFSILKKHGMKSYDEYVQLLDNGDASVHQEFVSALTTNTTEFFRDREQFDELDRILPLILEKKGKNPELRIWCAACSTGQEPYTIMMKLEDLRQSVPDFRVKMLATDIDLEVLRRSLAGVYTENDVAKLTEFQRRKYFKSLNPRNRSAEEKQLFQVQKIIQEPIEFAQFNLLQEPYPFKYPFDLIFLRNVLIYFERGAAEAVVNRMAQALGVGGYLFLGLSETSTVRSNLLVNKGTAIYQRKL